MYLVQILMENDTDRAKKKILNECIYPVWIHLPALKLNLWNAKSISKIASAVGHPITTDKLTANKKRLAYARVLVEVTMPSPLPDCITLKGPDGKLYNQKILYELKPRWCNHCKIVGHDTLYCKRFPRIQRWIPKVSAAQNTQKNHVHVSSVNDIPPKIQTTVAPAPPNDPVPIFNISQMSGGKDKVSAVSLPVHVSQLSEKSGKFQQQDKEKELSPNSHEIQGQQVCTTPQFSGLHSLVHGVRAQLSNSEGNFQVPQTSNAWTQVQSNKQRKKYTPANSFSQLEYLELDPSVIDRGGDLF
ncbi:uncharacterized protein LOC109831265 [Asparagus officinalis]|uniref:uncharacterized protein LOC109831265 n=1 Tax=Asparagus officinalis TaxID=4686 RepID=UPI00098E37F3|nr:uncharacterized protein LOC109831265 [Asparagus officinalis]